MLLLLDVFSYPVVARRDSFLKYCAWDALSGCPASASYSGAVQRMACLVLPDSPREGKVAPSS
jgi:hypothetical protein